MSLLRNAVLGGWRLVSFAAQDDSGQLRQPLGAHPRGLILYTADGWMSAQLAPDPSDRNGEIGDYIAYGGRFHVDETAATVRHDVVMATMPELLSRPQFRHCRVDGTVLTLSTSTTDEDGAATHSTLVWQRAAAESR